jgi:hypothetical protein
VLTYHWYETVLSLFAVSVAVILKDELPPAVELEVDERLLVIETTGVTCAAISSIFAPPLVSVSP